MFIPYCVSSAFLKMQICCAVPNQGDRPYHSWHSEAFMCPLFGISPGCSFLLPVTVAHFQGQPGAVSQMTFLAALIRSVLGRTGLDPEVLSRFSSSQWAGLELPHLGQLGILLTQGFSGHQMLILGIDTLFRRKASLTW